MTESSVLSILLSDWSMARAISLTHNPDAASMVAVGDRMAQALRSLAQPGRDEERDALWCKAIIATQDGSSGRMVCDVEKMLAYFNSSLPEEIPIMLPAAPSTRSESDGGDDEPLGYCEANLDPRLAPTTPAGFKPCSKCGTPMQCKHDGCREPTPPASAAEEVEEFLRSDYSHLMLQEKLLDLARRLDEARKERDAIKRIGARAQDRAEELQRSLDTEIEIALGFQERAEAAEQRVRELEEVLRMHGHIGAAAPGAEEGTK